MFPWAAIAAARGYRFPAELVLLAVLLTAVIILEYDSLMAGDIGTWIRRWRVTWRWRQSSWPVCSGSSGRNRR